MKTMIKHTIMVLSVLLVMGVIAVGNYGFASSGSIDRDFAPKADKSMMVVSDIIYDSSAEAGIDAVSKEAAAKSGNVTVESREFVTEPEEAVNDDSVVEDSAVEADYESEEVVVESEMDYQVDQGGREYTADEGYGEDEESSYVGGGYENANVDGAWISSGDFQYNGVHSDSSGWSYTYYSENVLPGGGLDIPGRHVDDEGYVCDADGNICIASDDLEYGTVVSVPFGSGTAVVYDSGSGSGNLDIYTSW